MTRPLMIALTAIATLAGCRSYPRSDPLFGRQTIPSQRTGALGALKRKDYGEPPPRDYYEGGSGGRPTPNGSPPPPTSPPSSPPPASGGGEYSPPGGFDYRGSGGQLSPSNRGEEDWVSPPSRNVSSGDGYGSEPGSSSVPIRGSGPDDWPSRYDNPGTPTDGARDGSPRPYEPSPLPPYNDGQSGRYEGSDRHSSVGPSGDRSRSLARSDVRERWERRYHDIMDLPPRGALPRGETGYRDVQAAGYSKRRYDEGDRYSERDRYADGDRYREPSPIAESGRAASVSTTMSSFVESRRVESRYAYEPSYRWLKGRLEYSHLNRRWKLRYIPISGDMDRFGGSVILADSEQLRAFQAGDFIRVDGHLSGDRTPGNFAPLFHAERIAPLH